MRKLVLTQSVTVDGVCDAQVFVPFQSDERNAYIRDTVFAADALVLGRTTYDLLAAFWPGQKNPIADRMNGLPKYVVSSRPLKAEWNHSMLIKKDVVEEIAKLKQQSGQYLLVIGSATLAQSLAQAGLIDEYKLLVHPIIAGSGKRFFNDGLAALKLSFIESKPVSPGMVLLHYEPAK
jgi:dihydrofolate reductase